MFVVHSLGQSESTAGLLAATAGLGRLAVDLPAGRVIARFGSTSVKIATPLMAAASVLCALKSSIAGLAVGLFIFGTGSGLATVAWQDAVSREVPKDQRASVSANLGGIMRLTASATPLLGSTVLQYASIEAVFFAQACLSLLPALLALRRRTAPKQPLSSIQGMSICTIVTSQSRALGLTGGFITGLQIMRECRRLVLPLLASRLGWSLRKISLLVSASYIFDFILFPLASYVYNKYGLRKASTISVVAFTVALGLMAGGTYTSALLWVGSAAAGLANGTSAGLGLAIGTELTPEHAGPNFAGVFRFICDFGECIAPVMCGFMLQHFYVWATFGLVIVCGWLGLWGYCLLGKEAPASPDKELTSVDDPITSKSIGNHGI